MGMARVIGLDLAFRNVGVVVADHNPDKSAGLDIVHCECIQTKNDPKKKARMYVAHVDVLDSQSIYTGLSELVGEYKPGLLVAEMPTGGSKSSRASRTMGIASGILGAFLAEHAELPSLMVTPDQSKLELCKKKTASKEEMQAGIRKLFPKVSWPEAKTRFEHIADATAALLVARHSDLFKMLVLGAAK